jgi:hypothetical protein
MMDIKNKYSDENIYTLKDFETDTCLMRTIIEARIKSGIYRIFHGEYYLHNDTNLPLTKDEVEVLKRGSSK